MKKSIMIVLLGAFVLGLGVGLGVQDAEARKLHPLPSFGECCFQECRQGVIWECCQTPTTLGCAGQFRCRPTSAACF